MKPILIAALAVVVACTPAPPADGAGADSAQAPSAEPGPVALTLDRSSYGLGDAVTLTLTNSGPGKYYFNPCPRIIERESGGAWTSVDEGPRMCTMEAWILDANGTRTAQTELSDSITPGRYRMVIVLTQEGQEPPSEGIRAVSAPFSVGG
jgi:hypothetical protein